MAAFHCKERRSEAVTKSQVGAWRFCALALIASAPIARCTDKHESGERERTIPSRSTGDAHWNIGALVQGGFGVTEDRGGFKFLMVGAQAGKVLTQSAPVSSTETSSTRVEVFPFWQSYTPKSCSARTASPSRHHGQTCLLLQLLHRRRNVHRRQHHTRHLPLELRARERWCPGYRARAVSSGPTTSIRPSVGLFLRLDPSRSATASTISTTAPAQTPASGTSRRSSASEPTTSSARDVPSTSAQTRCIFPAPVLVTKIPA